jgi:hypothetical protein
LEVVLLNDFDLVESLHKRRLSRQDVLLIILCVDHKKPKEVAEIKRLGRNAGLTEILKWNVSDILRYSKGLAIRLPEGWAITSNGKEHVRGLGILPEKRSRKVLDFASSLRQAAKRISDPDTIAFLEESIACFEAGLYRSAVVLSWVGAMSLLQNQVVGHHLATFNAEAQRRDSGWRPAKTKDDFFRMKESDFLDIVSSPAVGLFGKNVKEELKNNCLQLRNACGHPSSLKIGENRAAAYIEVLILNVFAKFS